MATSAPHVVHLPDGSHWLVAEGRGHQLTGTNQLRLATVMYGPPVEQDAADWQPDVIALELFGGPGEMEKVLSGAKPDPLGWWLVQSSTPQVEVTPEEAALIASDPEQPTDTTTGDDAISVRLPQIAPPPPPPRPEGADPNSPSLTAQILGAEGDRTPGLALPQITPYVPPDVVQPTTPSPSSPSISPSPTPGGEGPYNRPGAGAPVNNEGPYNRPAPNGPYDRPAPNGPYERPAPAQPYTRPADRGPYVRPGGVQSFDAASLRPRRLPPPSFPLLRGILGRTGQRMDWLDRIEGR